jgi:hypothetical protein
MNRHTLDLEHKTHLKKIQDSRTALESAEKHEKMEQDMHSDSFELLRKRYRLEAAQSALSNCKKNRTALITIFGREIRCSKYYDIAEGTTLEGEGTETDLRTPFWLLRIEGTGHGADQYRRRCAHESRVDGVVHEYNEWRSRA